MAKALARSKAETLATSTTNEGGQPLRSGAASSEETALYIAQFTAELSYLARRANLDLLAYLLDMARLEASRSAPQGTKTL
ncbi:hypothetical protein [Microvirga flavescens]|uniref:hypothetical protein n=1 Tax=Microvirga flavescens TaxID=2249811 RepID=UPI000DD9D704|nr:hypothetical protein [Microvirga flavescens]